MGERKAVTSPTERKISKIERKVSYSIFYSMKFEGLEFSWCRCIFNSSRI